MADYDEEMIGRVGDLLYHGLVRLYGQQYVDDQVDYIKRKYSDLQQRNYEQGGMSPTHSFVQNTTGKPERVLPAALGRYPEIKFDTYGYSYITVEHLRELIYYLDQHGVPDDTPLVTRAKGFKGKLRSIGVEGNLS